MAPAVFSGQLEEGERERVPTPMPVHRGLRTRTDAVGGEGEGEGEPSTMSGRTRRKRDAGDNIMKLENGTSSLMRGAIHGRRGMIRKIL